MYFWILTFFIMAQYMVELVCFSISPHTSYKYVLIWSPGKLTSKRASWNYAKLDPLASAFQNRMSTPAGSSYTLSFHQFEWNEDTKDDELELFWTIKKSGCQFTQKTRASVCKTLCPQHLLAPKYGQSKKISNDQELIQSDHTSCPQNQKGNNWIQKLTTVYEKHAR